MGALYGGLAGGEWVKGAARPRQSAALVGVQGEGASILPLEGPARLSTPPAEDRTLRPVSGAGGWGRKARGA